MRERIRKFLSYRFETQRSRYTAVVAVCILELVLAVQAWKRAETPNQFGFLVKRGSYYVVVWKPLAGGYRNVPTTSVKEALDFAQDKLHLHLGHNPIVTQELEHVWLQDRFGTYVVLWKMDQMANLNQLTFSDRNEALFFARAFREGSYSTSPFGHSILLTPSRTN